MRRRRGVDGVPEQVFPASSRPAAWRADVGEKAAAEEAKAEVANRVKGIIGPGRLTKSGVTGALNGRVASEHIGVWFSEGPRPNRNLIMRSARIGVDYAGPVWSSKLYRFSLRRWRRGLD
jgi:3-methyladenine DNA glycosylase Mpg